MNLRPEVVENPTGPAARGAAATGEPTRALLEEFLRFQRSKSGGNAGNLPTASPEAVAAIRRVIQISLANDPRGERVRAAWREMGKAALALLRALAERDPA